MDNQIMVSICCLAYNHELYIRKCLDGFIMQQTSFKFEVLIHDDASTDKTAEIIKEYEKMYPDIIKPIYQIENQYSKGVEISRTFQYPRAKGKYIAICEGDDYWIDERKLQKQVDYLEANPLCAMCVHQAFRIDAKTGKKVEMTAEHEDRDYSVEEAIIGGGSLFATNSVMIRLDLLKKYPECFIAEGFGDYQLFMYGAISGGLHYINDCMSVYNCGTIGSWTETVEKDRNKVIKHFAELITMLRNVNEYYCFEYDKLIEYKIKQTEYRLYKQKGYFLKILRKDYREFYNADLKNGCRPLNECMANACPWLYFIYKRVFI